MHRACVQPNEQQAICVPKSPYWWLGSCCPLCAGVYVRTKFSPPPKPSCCKVLCVETACCVCAGAPCSNDEFRTYNCDINEMLMNSVDEILYQQ